MIGISYRREDTAPITGRIYDRLQALFGRDRVFMDLDSIPFGVDFRTHISEALNRCDTLLVVIGPHWLGVSADGSRRIDDATDFVRFEVAQALSRDIRVIPLLIDRTEMPSSTVLPDDLKSLAFRNALRVDSGADFHHHINRLVKSCQTPWSWFVAFAPVLVKVGVWILIFGILITSGGIIDHKSVWPIVIGGIMIVVPILCYVFFAPHLKRRK
jgi:hypothetical protein